jgi:hypothetical protein
MKIAFKLVIVLIFCSPFDLFSQINNQLLEQNIEINDSLEHQVLLSIGSQNILKNNEYFHDISTGYTLFGSHLNAQLAYLPSKNIRIQGGVFLHKDFGNNTLTQVSPLITLKYQKNGFSFLIGNLEGNLSHRIIEPMFNYERYFSNFLENGIQFKFDKKRIWSDTWLNWEVMQYLNSDYQEQFTVGNSTQWKIYQSNQLEFMIPFQGIITHKGGQIDIDTTSLKSLANLALGFMVKYKRSGFIEEIKTENYVLLYQDLSPTKVQSFNKGHALFLNASFKSKYNVAASLGYWAGTNFLASRGGYLFQSESSIFGKKGYVESNRNLVFLRLLYQKELFPNFYMDVRMEPYIDLNNKFLEYAYSLFVTYKKDFSLTRVKK